MSRHKVHSDSKLSHLYDKSECKTQLASEDDLRVFKDLPDQHLDCSDLNNAECLATKILEETPYTIDAFNSLDEMVEYIREAMATKNVVCTCTEPTQCKYL